MKLKNMMNKLKNWFENPGEKIKSYAFVLFILESIIGLLGGFVLLIVSFFWLIDEPETGVWMLIGGVSSMVLALPAAWVSNILLYAFGELVENSGKQVVSPDVKKQVAPSDEKKQVTPPDAKKQAASPDAKKQAAPQTQKLRSDSSTESAQPTPSQTKEQIRQRNQRALHILEQSMVDVTCPQCKETLSFSKNATTAICPWCDRVIEIEPPRS